MNYSHDAARIEAATQRLAREMFERMRTASASFVQSEWWVERLMRQFMNDTRLKVQAFRLLDALPMMHDPADLARHLREYFAPLAPNHRQHADAALAELDPPRAGLATLAGRLMNFERLDGPRARLLAWAARRGAVAMAQRFIPGGNAHEAELAIRRLRDRRLTFTADVLGEAALSDEESARYQAVYLDLLRELPRRAAAWPVVPQVDLADGQPLPRVNVSVKLTSLFPRIDPIAPEPVKRAVKDRLRPLMRQAMNAAAHLHVDMEHYAIKDLTLAIFRELLMEDEFRDYPHFGIVLQAYLKDCDRDVHDFVDFARRRETPVHVRLVKGAYWDTETVLARQRRWPCPVWEQKWQSDACFERATRILLAHPRHIRTALASHNVRSLAHGMALKELWRLPDAAFELQMLFGMGDSIKRAAVAMGQRCRVYTPYGPLLTGMAYFIRRLLENTANESFLAHATADDTDQDALLADPVEIGRRTPPHDEPASFRFEFEEPLMSEFENTPLSDFAVDAHRQNMLSAISQVRAQLGRELPLVIGGQRLTTGRWANSNNPSRPVEVVGRVAQADPDLAARAVDAAADALPAWRETDPAHRADVLFHAAELIRQRRFQLAALQILECGKTWREADADVAQAVDFCSFYAHEILRITQHPRRRDIPGEDNEYTYAPRGVVAVITPWNFPLAIPCGVVAAALVAGNTVVLKPASSAAVTAAELVQLFEEAGLPAGALNFLPGPGAVLGEPLVSHPRVNMVAFTGSRDVGCRIHRLASHSPTAQPGLRHVIAEMGGKNAIIIDSDADLDEAIKGVLSSAFGYAGQKCSACSRAIVLDAVHDRFVSRLVEAARGLSVGPADDPATAVPPVIDAAARDAVLRHIETARREATCALSLDTAALAERTGGFFVGPAIFTDVPPSAAVARDEVFGPVLAVIRARDFQHALELFNATDYALAGGVYSRSPANIALARRRAECGNLYINRAITDARVDLQPFGGFKLSGTGPKTGGPDYLIQFCQPRCITENTLRRGFAPTDDPVESLR